MGWQALIGKNFREVGVVGDDPWDILDECVEKLVAAYEKDWHRKPNYEEIEYYIEFFSDKMRSIGEKHET